MTPLAHFRPTTVTADHTAVIAAKERLIRAMQTRLPNVNVATLERQAQGYMTYKSDLHSCAYAMIDFLTEYTEIVRSIGNDEQLRPDKAAALEAVMNWLTDELSAADDWADEVLEGTTR